MLARIYVRKVLPDGENGARFAVSFFFYKGGRGGGKGNFSLTLPIEWFRCRRAPK